ncbi:cytochrome b/b6 domain-containing protein [Phenylobacterium sp.]|jgi:cytochrome b561/polyisoprenoid-binding protein YceI|uniref:cytochrome b/b6 domain-containing protein n=1 Tax=Phenylobacterium sp. TaxID=1871053 RepID=UPI002F933FE7
MTEASQDPRAVGSGRYAAVAIALHWTIAAAILLQIVLASRMEDRSPEAFAVVQLHKSVGITILLLSLVRLAWRLLNPPPPLPETMARWERTLARLTHAGFYLVMVGMPLTGWIMVSTSEIRIPTLLFGLVPWPHLPLAGEAWHDVGEGVHESLIKVFYVLAALHVAGALKHQLFSRDEPVLARMAPGARAGRWFEPRLFPIGLAALAVAGFGLVVQPPAGVATPRQATSGGGEPLEAQEPRDVEGGDRWSVQPGSSVTFATAWGGRPIEGRIGRWDADIRFDPAELEKARVRVRLDLASVTTGDRQRDQALGGPDWFDLGRHARAEFEAEDFRKTAGGFVAHGTLTMRGVSRPLDLPFRLTIAGDRAQAQGEVALDRRDFGVGQGEWARTDQVPGQVRVRIGLVAARKRQQG